MRQLNQQTLHRMESIFIFFILTQPILDVTAYFGLPVSELIRVLVMLFGMFYLLLYSNKTIQHTVSMYLTVLLGYFAVHLIVSYIIKVPFSFSIEFTHIIKTLFFIVMLIVYVVVLLSFRSRANWQEIILRNLTINMGLIGLIMLVADISGTGRRSYDMLTKAGHSGWFFSGNELSAILVMGFGVTLLYTYRQPNKRLKLLLFCLLALLGWSMMTIGTKVSFGGMFLLLLINLTRSLFEKGNWLNRAIPSLLLIIAVLWLPFSPIGHNVDLTIGNTTNYPTDQSIDPADPGLNDVLSGRGAFLQQTMTQFNEAPWAQKIFGLGYGGNYLNQPKLIEMDLLDWFFGFGIVGFILLCLPIIFVAIKLIHRMIQAKKDVLTMETMIIVGAICIAVGAGFVAGHVLSSPAVSLYLAVLIGYLVALFYPSSNNQRGNLDE